MSGLVAVIQQVVDEKTKAGDMFTAFDITTEVRNRGHWCKHPESRDIVHNLYQQGTMGVDYTRTKVDVGTGILPWLYHRLVDDPNTYPAIVSQNVEPSATDDNDNDTYTTDDNDNDTYTYTYNDDNNEDNDTQIKAPINNVNKLKGRQPDARGSLTVPCNLIRNLGYCPKEKVKVFVDVDKLEISDKGYTSVLSWREYTVDKNNQIRITKGVLQALGGQLFNCDFQGNKVIVSAA